MSLGWYHKQRQCGSCNLESQLCGVGALAAGSW